MTLYIAAAALFLCCCCVIGGLYFHRRKQKNTEEELTPYEKWARNEEMKLSGEGPQQFTRYSLNPRRASGNVLGAGTAGAYDDSGYINNPMKNGSQHNPMNDSQRPDRYDDDGDYDDEGNWVSNQNDEPLEEPDEPYVNYSEDDEPLDEPPAPRRSQSSRLSSPGMPPPAPRPSSARGANYDQFRQSAIYGGRKSVKGGRKKLTT